MYRRKEIAAPSPSSVNRGREPLCWLCMAGTVCLTFDFDALSIWINRRQTSPASLSRGEFGAVAVPRILHLLSTYRIPSTWFIPGHTIETYRSHCEQVVKSGHEIGLH